MHNDDDEQTLFRFLYNGHQMMQQCKYKSWWCFPYNWLVSCQHPESKNERLCSVCCDCVWASGESKEMKITEQ